MVPLSVSIQQKYCFASNLSLPGCSHVGPLFTIEEQGWACDVMYTSATHARPIPYVTDFVRLAVFMAMFSQLSNVEFEQTRPKSG